jgi:polyisoprenoid-binding protein YceI
LETINEEGISTMKTTGLGLLLLSLALTTPAEEFTVDPRQAEIGFSVKHLMVSNVKGSFNTFEGTLDYDIANRELQSVQGFISTGSIDTNNQKRDEHLKNTDYFNIEAYPKMEFQSTGIDKQADGSFKITGNLKVLGVNHEIVLPATVTGPVDDAWGNQRIGIESTVVLNRRDLGITSSPAAMIGDKVKVRINAEAAFKP